MSKKKGMSLCVYTGRYVYIARCVYTRKMCVCTYEEVCVTQGDMGVAVEGICILKTDTEKKQGCD